VSGDIAAIAAGLSRAQVKRLAGVQKLRERGISWASALGDIRACTSIASTNALLNMGLIGVDVVGNCYVTSAGLAVRVYLEGQGDA
jgi:hypothetical protein